MEKSKKKEGLSRLFENSGAKERSAHISRSVVGWQRSMYACALLGCL